MLTNIESRLAIITYDADMLLGFSLIFLGIFILLSWLTIITGKKIIGKVRGSNFAVLLIFLLALISPILAQQRVSEAFSEIGYIKCGRFLETPDSDKRQSLFPKRAWVLNASDCAKAEAHPPRAVR
jgi:hypothetical protein